LMGQRPTMNAIQPGAMRQQAHLQHPVQYAHPAQNQNIQYQQLRQQQQQQRARFYTSPVPQVPPSWV
jgi:hypothetical protein